jgi:hypothetical protein
MVGSFLSRIRLGFGMAGGPGGSVSRKVATHFARLSKVKGSLPTDAGRYAAEGDNPSVLLSLEGQPARQCWRMRRQIWPRRDESGLFKNLAAWRVDQMRRFGEICAALEPITYDWGHFGTKKSPDWLRHTVTSWMGHDRKGQPIEILAAMAEDGGMGVAAVLDIVFCRDATSYGSNNSVDRFSGVSAWLTDQREAVASVFAGLNADVRAELVSAIGRFGLHEAYLDLLLEGATGSSKKARSAARQALTGARADSLTAAIEKRYGAAAPGQRAELVEVIAATLGAAASDLLGRLKEGEASAKVLAAFDRTAGAASPPNPLTSGPWARTDGPSGYAAVDGGFVELPSPPPLPGPTMLDPAALDLLVPAMEEFNRLLAAGRAAAVERWHWSRQYSSKNARDLERLKIFAESDYRITQDNSQKTVDWLRFHQLKHPAILEFFCDPRVSIYHLVRIAVALSNGFIQGLFGDWSGPVGAAVQRRLQQGEDIRTVLALWSQAGGRDHIGEHLTQRWYWPLPHLDAPLWPELCSRFSQLDEALGMVPQSSSETLRPLPALEFLAMFPRLPERYRGRLMLLANDSSAKLREPARALLQKTPDIGGAIAMQLEDGRQETRALAADWLAQRGDTAQVPAIRKQLKKERSDLARAAMITALERLGDDVSDFFDYAAMVKEARAGLAKTKIKGLDWFPLDQLPSMHWADGKAVDPVLPQWWVVLSAKLKNAGGNALIDLWLDRLAPGDAHKLGWMVLTSWIEQDTRAPSDEESNAHAAAHVDATLQQYISYAKRWPQYAQAYPTDRDTVFAQLKRQMANTYLGSAADSKGILALASRVNGADAAHRVRSFLKDHGSRVSQAKALLEVLASIGSSAALQVVLGASNRSKQRSVQAHAAALVAEIAERNGWTPAQLADRTIPTGGLDADGTLELECGENRTYRAQLDAQDSLIILNAEGREVKALPGPRMDQEKPAIDAAKKLLSTARKEVKQVLTAQTERLKEAMCLERRWSREDWESYIAAHPIVGRIATRLVWLGHDSEGNVTGTFRPLGDASFSDAADNDVDISAFDEIGLAHSSRLTSATIEEWRTHLKDYAVASPFDQLGRDLPKLTDAMAKSVSITDREGWMIETFKLRGIAGKLGYVRGQAQDGGWFMTYERPYRDAGLVAEIEFTGSPLPEENMQAALQSLCFRRLRANGLGGGQVPLEEVPAVLLAESWQDLRDIAEKGTGYDSDWSKKAG